MNEHEPGTVASAARGLPGAGFVSLVGAGPGDPDLLTVRALRALESADAVLYDRLVAPEILALAPADALREFAGKRAGDSHLQSAINARLIQLARRHRHVVRLKGGDPFVFGRGGEEALALAQAGIRYAIIPGITAAVGCAASAGIPLTHRGLARQVTFVTAQQAVHGPEPDWASLASTGHTVVFYMGVAELPRIEAELLRHGRAAATPVALIENGCTAAQRVFRGTLHGLAALAGRVALQAPALVLVGEVADLALASEVKSACGDGPVPVAA